MTADRRPLLRRVADGLRAADPGFERATTAVRAVLAAGIGGGASVGMLTLLGRPVAPAGLAAFVGLLGVLSLPPGPPRAWGQAVVGATVVAGSGAALLGDGPAGLAFAMVVTAACAWGSRWGPTGRAAGFLGFLAALLTLRLGLGPGNIPGLALSMLCAVLAVLVTVRVLVRARPAPTGRRLARSLLAQLSVFVDALEQLAELGPGSRRQRRARVRLVRVQETALLLDQALAELDGVDPGATGVDRAAVDTAQSAGKTVHSAATISKGAATISKGAATISKGAATATHSHPGLTTPHPRRKVYPRRDRSAARANHAPPTTRPIRRPGKPRPTHDATFTHDVPGLRSAVLDVEALADHLLWSVLTIPADAAAELRREAAVALQQGRIERDQADLPTDPLVPRSAGQEDRFDQVVRRLAAAARRVRLDAADLHQRHRPRLPTVGPTTSSTRITIQTTIAAVGSLLLGQLIAPFEWYWAVIGAYIIVTTTSSRGAGFRKAADRLLGTAVGVIAGLAIAHLLSGTGSLLLGALIGALAVMVWVFGVNYALFTFVLTIAVALLYQVVGTLTTQILALRLAETALGVGLASVVVAVVMPVSTRRTIGGAVEGLLDALDDALVDLDHDGRLAHDRVREVDRAVSAVRQVTAPVVAGLPLATGSQARAARLLATALRVRVAALATATATAPATHDDRAVLPHLRGQIVVLKQHLADNVIPTGAAEEIPDSGTEVARILRGLDDRLAGYGTTRGISLRGDPGALAGGTARLRD